MEKRGADMDLERGGHGFGKMQVSAEEVERGRSFLEEEDRTVKVLEIRGDKRVLEIRGDKRVLEIRGE